MCGTSQKLIQIMKIPKCIIVSTALFHLERSTFYMMLFQHDGNMMENTTSFEIMTLLYDYPFEITAMFDR